MKVLVFSDVHIGLRGYGDPEAALTAALDHARANHPNADCAVFLGDLVDDGDRAEYETLNALVAQLLWPLRFILGNHDNRAGFRSVFGTEHEQNGGFVQQEAKLCGVTCLFLDTLMEGEAAGWLCSSRLDWLDGRLAAATRPCLIFMHHPPILTHTASCDQIGLRDRDAFAALLRCHPGKVEHILFGHCHFPVMGSVAGVPATGLGSVLYQNRPNQADARFLYDPGRPGSYGVLTGNSGDITIWTEEIPASGGPRPREM